MIHVMSLCVVPALCGAAALSVDSTVRPQNLLTPVRYELTLRLDFAAERLDGTARVTVSNAGERAVDTVPLLLYRLMTVTNVRATDGAPVSFTQEVVADKDVPRLQVNQILVALRTPLAPAARLTIEVAYGGYLLGYSETGMRYIRDRIDPAFTLIRNDAYAFPMVGYAAKQSERSAPKAAYDYVAHITVPDSLVVANGGSLVERKVANGNATYVYRNILPAWRMDFAIGPYREMHVGPVRVFFLQRDSVGAQRVARAARGALDLFTSWFGAPPDEVALTLLEIEDGFGSQADVTTVLQSAAAFRDSTRLYEVYHELSHLWNPPDTDRPSSRWNEGLASFLEELATEKLEHRPAIDRRADQIMHWLRDLAAKDERLRTVPMAHYGREDMAGMSYSVGMLLFDVLYRVMGEEEFLRFVGGYSARYASSGAGLAELVTFAERSSTADLKPVFRDWVATCAWHEIIRDAASMATVAQRYRRTR